MTIPTFLSSTAAMIVYGVTGALTAAIALFWSKYPLRWLLAIATVALILVVLLNWDRVGDIDPQLPQVFQKPYFMAWILFLGLASLYLLTHFTVMMIRAYGGGPGAAGTVGAAQFADIDAAWQEIVIQLSQARISPADQSLYLLLTPDESLAASVIDAAGLQLFAKAPAAVEAPIHCYAIAEGLFLSFAGACALGRQSQEGTARLEHLCRLIVAENPERPILRGVAVLLPYEWESGQESLPRVAAVRDDIQTIRRTFKVRCPTLAVFCLRESLAGFNEFASRLPVKLRHNRCGFSVPTSLAPGGDVFRHGMLWMTQWFQSWSLNLMVQEIRNKDGNGRLLSMIAAFRGGKVPLARLLESALTTHQQAQPVLFRGCYFVACGPDADKKAFAAGLFNGARGRLLADHQLTTWSHDADHLDQGYRRASLIMGLVCALIVLPIWYFGIIGRLNANQPGTVWAGWLGMILLALIWGVALLAPRVRKVSAPAKG